MSAVLNALRRLSGTQKRTEKGKDEGRGSKSTSERDFGEGPCHSGQTATSELANESSGAAGGNTNKMPILGALQRKGFNLSVLNDMKPRKASTFSGK